MTNGYFSWGSGLATLSNINIRIPTGRIKAHLKYEIHNIRLLLIQSLNVTKSTKTLFKRKKSENPELYEVMNYIGCVTSLLT